MELFRSIRAKNEKFIRKRIIKYLNKIDTETLLRYGVYQIEADGLSLFEYIKGDRDSIMGLPIKQIMNYIKNYKMSKKIFAIIGNPVDHSLSPILHKYWFKKYNINATYELIKIK